MSELENAVDTVLRLINSRIRVTKDNSDAAKLLATEAAFDRELLLKEYDAQITLQIDPVLGIQDQKLNMSGSLRRQVHFLRCTVHTIDKVTPGADAGRVMRNKVAEQIKAIVRENRTLPYQTVYNFAGIGYPEGDPHKAYAIGASTELAPSSSSWAELSAVEYQGIWYSADVRYSKSVVANNQYGLMLYRFKVGPREQCVKSLVLSFEGYGTAPGGNGVTVKVWNHVTGAWQYPQYGTAGTDETLTITISANWIDFIDADGYVWMIAKTTNPSNGVTPAVLYCDCVQLTVQVRGITNCDVLSYKPTDIVDVKPFLFKTEFVLKGWAFENITLG